MHRVLIERDAPSGSELVLRDEDQVRHLVRALRARPGEAIECLDGRGARVRGEIVAVDRKTVTVRVHERLLEPPEPHRLTLGLSLIRPERFEWALEKACELGVARVIPLQAARVRIRGDAASRLPRWRKILDEAMLQCGQAWRTELGAPARLAKVLEAAPPATALLTLEDPAQSFTAWLAVYARAPEALILIGPEGDFTPEEAAAARAGGASTVRLAGQALRAETAAVAAAALCRHAAGRL